jgi:glycerol kinase
MLYDIDALDWSDELLDLFGVPRALLPAVHPSSGVVARADESLFRAAAPIAGIAGDQQAALFGQGCVRAGQAKNTYGTGAFLLLHTGSERVLSRYGLLTTVACGPRGEPAYALEGSVFIAGAAIQWLRDGLRILGDAAESESLARELDSNDGVYFVPAFVGLGAPHWNPEARGTIVGLTRGTGREHLARAALEAMAYATRDVLDAMIVDSGASLTTVGADGGAARNDWLMQFQADLLGVAVCRPTLVETTALGAAGLAGIGAGVWADADEFLATRDEPVVFVPAMDDEVRDRCLRGWRRAVRAALAWAESHGAQ